MNKLQEIINTEGSVLMPVAHDALSAKIIKQVGFKAMSIGGFAISATRHGFPDFGIVSYKEMKDAISDIVSAGDLPCLVDADGGYGDFLNVERVIRDYEKEPNISCIFLEDQVHPKRCGHLSGKRIISSEEMELKLRVASSTRNRKDLWIMARTDARSINGLDEALRRGEKYLKAGADAIFIESPESIEELEIIGKTFKGVPLLANMLEGGKTPMLSRKELADLGFSIIAHPVATLLAVAKATEDVLIHLKEKEETNTISRDRMWQMKKFHDLIGVTDALAKEQELLK